MFDYGVDVKESGVQSMLDCLNLLCQYANASCMCYTKLLYT